MWSFYFLYYYFLLFFRSSCHLYLYFLFFLRTVLIFAHVMRSIVGCSWMQSNDNISDEWLNWSTKSHEISYEITIDWANSCRIGVPLGRLRMPCFAANELVICFFFFSILIAFPDNPDWLFDDYTFCSCLKGIFLGLFSFRVELAEIHFVDGFVDSIIVQLK